MDSKAYTGAPGAMRYDPEHEPAERTECYSCHKPLDEEGGDVTWLDVETCRQTMSSPAEYERQPFCDWCSQNDYAEHVAEERAERRLREKLGL